MRRLFRKLSYEDCISRLPSIIPSYDSEGKLYFFSLDDIEARDRLYPSNYGLIPVNVQMPDGTVLTFHQLADFYSFAKTYYDMIRNGAFCMRRYESAVDFYDGESRTKNLSLLPFGPDRETYEEMDERMAEYNSYINDGESFMQWCEKNFVPIFRIDDHKLSDYWKVTELSYPSVIYWIGWFEERSLKYQDIEDLTHCKESDDCCECEEFFRRGGTQMLSDLKEWLQGIKPLTELSEGVDWTPKAAFALSMAESRSPIGNGFLMAEDYVLGRDYSKASTVVSRDGEILYHAKNGQGYVFNTTYMEPQFAADEWSGMTLEEYYGEDYNSLYKPPYTYYAYKTDGTLVTSNTNENEVKNQLYDVFECAEKNDNGYVLLKNGDIVPCLEGEIFTMPEDCGSDYLKGKHFIVYREEYPTTPYIMVNGVKYKATLSPKNLKFYFERYDAAHEQDFDLTAIADNEKVFYMEKGEPVIDLTTADRIVAYGDLDGVRYVVSGQSNALYFDGSLQPLTSLTYGTITYRSDSNTIKCDYRDKQVYNISHVSGITSSKLLDLATASNIVYDNVGTKIPGVYKGATEFWSPPQGTILDLIYQVGNVSQIRRFAQTDTEHGRPYVIGNIITSMTFYFKFENGLIDDATKSEARVGHALEAIEAAIAQRKMNEDNGAVYEDILYCDIVYHNGATLEVTQSQDTPPQIQYKLAHSQGNQKFHHGVRYKETVRFRKVPVNYVIKRSYTRRPSNNPKKTLTPYTSDTVRVVWVYELVQNKVLIENNQYGAPYEESLAEFDYELYRPEFVDMEDTTIVSPTYMRDYMLGIVSPRNLDSDIYIDRGINAAYELHLKLGEVSSLESLTKYTNGFYKIQKDD